VSRTRRDRIHAKTAKQGGMRAGFTLIELLIVVVIVGVLASIAIPKFSSMRVRAFRGSVISDLKNLASAQEIYHTNNYTYTTSLTDLAVTSGGSTGVYVTINEADVSGWAATATHSGVTTGQCGIFYGDASASNGDPAATPGVVGCDF